MKKGAVFGAVLLILASQVLATTYKIIDLGTLGGRISGARAINDFGQVVGWSKNAEGQTQAFIWSKSAGMMGIGNPSAYSQAFGINGLDQVVGLSDGQGFIWEKFSGLQPLGFLSNGIYSNALDINDSSQVVGSGDGYPNNSLVYYIADSLAFGWTESFGLTQLATPAWHPVETYARGINANGEVAGSARDAINADLRAVKWDTAGNLVYLSMQPSVAFAINDSGFVVGNAGNLAYLWFDDWNSQFICRGAAYDINNAGQVVGSYEDRAYVWDSSGLVNLGALPGGHASAAFGINNLGQIVGWSLDAQSTQHAVLWEPEVPEPSSLILLATGSGLILLRRSRRT